VVIGTELWKSDGTPAGTVLVKDIRAGSGDGLNFDNHFVGFHNKVYFSAYDSSSGLELWESNGTKQLLFIANDENGFKLWKTDGTDAGTIEIMDEMNN